MNKRVYILKTGSTHPEMAESQGDFDDWIIAGTGLPGEAVQVVDLLAGQVAPDYTAVSGVIVGGSHHMVTERLPWSEAAAEWLGGAAQRRIPILGICYGHQLLAHALGGLVGDNPRGWEFGTVMVELESAAQSDRLFAGLPNRFPAQVAHTQSVLRLPAGATLLASSAMEPCHAFRCGENSWGVQFHPEFNTEPTRFYLEQERANLEAQGQDVETLLEKVIESPESTSLLASFARIVTSFP